MILAHLANFAQFPAPLAMFFQEAEVGFSPMQLWGNMNWPARMVVLVLFIMSIWSLAVMIDRAMYFNAARKQSSRTAHPAQILLANCSRSSRSSLRSALSAE